MASVTFYTYPLAFNPAKAKLALDEKGIKYIEKKIDIIGSQSLEPWYIKLNPAGSAPTLVAGDKVIPESSDIIRWADEQGDGPLGGDKVDRQFVAQWLKKVDSWDGNLYAAAWSGAGSFLKVSNNHKIKVAEAAAKRNPDLADVYKKKIESLKRINEEPSNKELVEANKAQLVELLDEADIRLSSMKYLAGDEYSMADVIFTPVLYRIPQVSQEKELLDPRVNVKKYWGDLKQRPSYKTTFAASDNPVYAAKTALPSLFNILYSKVTNQY
ncbi:unnamed protein product [Calypogeia fissa]